MRIAFWAASAGLVLAACAPPGLSKSELAALPITAKMPTGSASYAGKLEAKYAGGASTFTDSFDFSLAANFDAKTVQAVASNYSSTQINGANTYVATATANISGAGTISGSGFTIPKVSGTYTPTSLTLNGVSQALPGVQNYTSSSAITANFVGDSAQGIYGTGPISGGTYEVYGNKQ